MSFSKPLFTQNGEYALVDVNYKINMGKFKKWDVKKPWKIFGRNEYFIFTRYYKYIYQRIDGKWTLICVDITPFEF